MAAVFAGSFVHTLDGKGRTTLPARFREVIPPADLEAPLYLRADADNGRLVVLTYSLLEEIAAAEAAATAMDNARVSAWQTMAAHLTPVRLDPQGRFAIPAAVARRAGLAEGKVRFSGGMRVFFIQPAAVDEDPADQGGTS